MTNTTRQIKVLEIDHCGKRESRHFDQWLRSRTNPEEDVKREFSDLARYVVDVYCKQDQKPNYLLVYSDFLMPLIFDNQYGFEREFLEEFNRQQVENIDLSFIRAGGTLEEITESIRQDFKNQGIEIEKPKVGYTYSNRKREFYYGDYEYDRTDRGSPIFYRVSGGNK